MTESDSTSRALQRVVGLLETPPPAPDVERGYLNLLGDAGPAATGIAQSFMLTRVIPAIYERWWRPAFGWIAKGLTGPSMAEEHLIARDLLELTPGDMALDVACGPGNFTRDFAGAVGDDGLVVGIDASVTMLERAVGETGGANVVYVRGDAVTLPFRRDSFDAVCCFAALHLFADPFAALDHMARVLVPGGRISILTSCRPGRGPLRAAAGALGAVSGMRMFELGEVTGALADRGVPARLHRVAGLAQFVGGRKAPRD